MTCPPPPRHPHLEVPGQHVSAGISSRPRCLSRACERWQGRRKGAVYRGVLSQRRKWRLLEVYAIVLEGVALTPWRQQPSCASGVTELLTTISKHPCLPCDATNSGEIVETCFSLTLIPRNTPVPCCCCCSSWPAEVVAICRPLKVLPTLSLPAGARHQRLGVLPSRHRIARSSNVLQSLSLPSDYVEPDVDRRLVSPALRSRRRRRSSPDAHRVRHRHIDDPRNQTQNSPSSPLLFWSSVVGGWVRFRVGSSAHFISPRPLSSVRGTPHLWALRQHLLTHSTSSHLLLTRNPRTTGDIRKSGAALTFSRGNRPPGTIYLYGGHRTALLAHAAVSPIIPVSTW